MKNKWLLFSSIFQIIVGLTAMIFFVILFINDAINIKWVGTAILSVLFIIIGIIELIDYIKEEK